MTTLFLDFETRSRIDLRAVGAHRYFEDESTEVLSAGYAADDEPVRVWTRGEHPGWLTYVQDPSVVIVAHNAEFERLALEYCFGIRLPASRFRCTAALLASYGLPRSLDAGGQVLLTEHRKMADVGDRVLHKLSKPRRPSMANPDEFWEEETAPDDFAEMYEYNAGDVDTMRDIYHVLPALSIREQRVWELTVKMNDRGLLVDREAIGGAIKLVSTEAERLVKRWQVLTRGSSTPTSSNAAAVLNAMAPSAKITSVDKLHVRKLLKRTDLPGPVLECLRIRKRLARSSLAKLRQLLQRCSADGRYRGGYVFAGAERTQRWSSWGVQLHNLPRGLGDKTDDAFQALLRDMLPVLYDDVLGTVSDMLKGFFVGPFLMGDYAQIEARVLAWYAKQQRLLDMFARGEDVYLDMAKRIYGVDRMTADDYDEALHMPKRQLGKITILACGFGMSGGTFSRNADVQWDIDIPLEKANTIVMAYRNKYPNVPSFWARVEHVVREAIRRDSKSLRPTPDAPWYAGTREFQGRRFATVGLPSGRSLWYYDPFPDHPGKWPSGDPKTSMMYLGRPPYGRGGAKLVEDERSAVAVKDPPKGATYLETYGGKLVENMVQKTARDMMADRMLALDDAGFPLVLTTHDEVGAEGRKEDLAEFKRVMSDVPKWAEGLPVAVDAHWSGRYHK
jgi:DNA polymerase bacteriophage-type